MIVLDTPLNCGPNTFPTGVGFGPRGVVQIVDKILYLVFWTAFKPGGVVQIRTFIFNNLNVLRPPLRGYLGVFSTLTDFLPKKSNCFTTINPSLKGEKMKVYEFQKNAQDKVILSFTEFKGKLLFDLRVYYNAGKTEEDWRPTQKGITVRLEFLQDLKEGIDKAYDEWKKTRLSSDK